MSKKSSKKWNFFEINSSKSAFVDQACFSQVGRNCKGSLYLKFIHVSVIFPIIQIYVYLNIHSFVIPFSPPIATWLRLWVSVWAEKLQIIAWHKGSSTVSFNFKYCISIPLPAVQIWYHLPFSLDIRWAAGVPNVWITINISSFLLTCWRLS